MRTLLLAVGLTCAWAFFVSPAKAGEMPATSAGTKLESVLGREVTTLREGDGGRVIDLLVDADGKVRAAVVEFGGFLGIGTRKVVIEWSAFRFAGEQITVDVSRDQVRAAPEYKPKDPPVVVKSSRD